MHARGATASAPRPAASLMLLRDGVGGPGSPPRLLMGLRPAGARFMPSVWVFPGGALDPALDARARPDETPLGPLAQAELSIAAQGADPAALARCALRETEEETGLRLRPDLAALRYAFRAITPRALPLRFDARFFAVRAADLAAAPLDDAAPNDGEFDAVAWIGPQEAAALPIAGITRRLLGALWRDAAQGRALGPGAAPPRLIDTESLLTAP